MLIKSHISVNQQKHLWSNWKKKKKYQRSGKYEAWTHDIRQVVMSSVVYLFNAHMLPFSKKEYYHDYAGLFFFFLAIFVLSTLF